MFCRFNNGQNAVKPQLGVPGTAAQVVVSIVGPICVHCRRSFFTANWLTDTKNLTNHHTVMMLVGMFFSAWCCIEDRKHAQHCSAAGGAAASMCNSAVLSGPVWSHPCFEHAHVCNGSPLHNCKFNQVMFILKPQMVLSVPCCRSLYSCCWYCGCQPSPILQPLPDSDTLLCCIVAAQPMNPFPTML